MLCAIYAWLAENRNQDELAKMDAILWKPPPGVEKEIVAEQDARWNKEAMANDFMASLARAQAR